MTWTIFITIWIILQGVVKVARQPKLCKLEGKNEAWLLGSIVGCTLWAPAMIYCLYLAGLYE